MLFVYILHIKYKFIIQFQIVLLDFIKTFKKYLKHSLQKSLKILCINFSIFTDVTEIIIL
jgi:hypothetical protein